MKNKIFLTSALMIVGCAAQPPPQLATYVPTTLTNPPPKAIDVGPDPLASLPAAIRIGYDQPRPPVVHEGITTMLPYDAHAQPTVNCAILRVTEIVLGSGEIVKPDDIGIGDSERWSIKVSGNRVLVKPKESGLATDLVIVTNLRSYHFALRTRRPYQPQVSFYYLDQIRVDEAHHLELTRQARALMLADPSSKPLNFAYKIQGPSVAWRPLSAFDDGAHLYIEFPQNIAGTDMPALMALQGSQQATVNYQVHGQYYVADRLLDTAVLTSGTGANRQTVQITAARQTL
jgi:type IV secretion system protein TrbG